MKWKGILALSLAIAAACATGAYGASAIGQLEDLTGQKIDRPRIDREPVPAVPAPAPRPSSRNSSSTRALIVGTLMQSFLDGFNSANANAQQAELDRQLAEQQRLLEEQRARAARFLAASHLREFWDEQDRERSASLSGLLGVPLQGTALFGIPPNPSSSAIRDMLAPVDPFANDPNVVDLRGVTNPTPALLRGATDPTPAESGGPAGLQQGAAYVPPSVTPSQAGVRQGTVPALPDPATRVYEVPGSEGKPNSEKRILVLGVGSTMTEVLEAAKKYKGLYDIIIGTDIEDSKLNAYYANNDKELARQKYSEPILKALRKIAHPENPNGKDKLEFAAIDMHSKGLLAFSSLLKEGSVSAAKVTAYGPAVGENDWALDDLTTYAGQNGQPRGSVVVKVNPDDPVPIATQFHPGIAGLAAWGTIWLTDENPRRLSDYLKTHSSLVEVVPVEMPGVTGRDNHYLENYLLYEHNKSEEKQRWATAVIEEQKRKLTIGRM